MRTLTSDLDVSSPGSEWDFAAVVVGMRIDLFSELAVS